MTEDFRVQRVLRTRGRIAAHVVWDYVTRPSAMAIGDVPWCAEAITPEWLTAVLCGNAADGARVISTEVSGGDQGSSVRRQLKVGYNENGRKAGLPERLFCKTTPTLLTRLAAGIAAGGEARFYRQIRPELNIEAPVCYHSAWDRASGRSVHLLNDVVAAKGALFCRWHSVISRRNAEEIVDTLAALHSRYYDTARFKSDLKWVGTYEDFLFIGAKNGIRECHERAMIEAESAIPSDVLRRKVEIWPLTIKGLEFHKSAPRTLLHSDVHLGNWYVTGDGRMGLCDWQCLCTGHWARDVAYAISTTLAIEDRRAWERELLERYLEQMRAKCRLEVGFEEAWSSYRQQMFAALLMWTPTLVHPRTMPDMQPEAMSLEMIRRITAAISDLDSFSGC